MKILILLQHDRRKILGYVYTKDHKLLVKFNKDAKITREMFFNIFSGGVSIKEGEYNTEGDIMYITKAQIWEFSLHPKLLTDQQWIRG